MSSVCGSAARGTNFNRRNGSRAEIGLHARCRHCVMDGVRLTLAMSLAVALTLQAADPVEVYREARKAERSGDVVRAYLLYAQAAAGDPGNRTYWAKSLALRTQAVLKAKVQPAAIEAEESAEPEPADTVSAPITEKDLAEARRLLPPPEIEPARGVKDVRVSGNAQKQWEEMAKLFGLDTVFDGDFQPGKEFRLQLDAVDYRQAFAALQAATGTFAVPLGKKLLFIAKDTEQKRRDMEPVVAVAGSIPEPVSVQDATECARTVQQALEIQKFAIDSTRRLVLIRDRISRVRPAQHLFEQLLFHRSQVIVDVEFIDIDRKSDFSFGLNLPNSFTFNYLGNALNSKPSLAGAASYLYGIGGGGTLLGIAIAAPSLLFKGSKSSAETLMKTRLLSVEGQAVSLHIGDKYPIATGQYSSSSPSSYVPPPSFNFEDLGLTLKVIAKVHGTEEVSLDVEAEFKVLGGGALDGIPVIQSRKFKSMVRLKEGEAAMMAGLMSASEARTISGLYGLTDVPVLGALVRQTSKSRERSQVMLVLTPHIVAQPPSAADTKMIWVGSEGRTLIPL